MSVKEIKKILKKKDLISYHLYEWAETFDGEIDEDGEPTTESYDIVYSLAERLENNQCNEEDYENILFHIDQINYDEIKIKFSSLHLPGGIYYSSNNPQSSP